ncbi:MAG: hypothetical protein FJW81_06945 [Actinobacteria bacterium]|nr:hypothetical protein [Actinomycetota bacterium]
MRSATLIVAGAILLVAAVPASAQVRLATIVGVSGSLTGRSDFQGTWNQADYPEEKDACIQRRADVAYALRMIGQGPVVEIDFRYPAKIRPVITTVGVTSKRQLRLRVTATKTSGSARSLPGEFNSFVNCGLQTPPAPGDDEVAPLVLPLGPANCSFRPAVFILNLQNQMLGALSATSRAWEDQLTRCSWTATTAVFPSNLGAAKGDWARQRVFFEEGAPGTTVAVTYRLDYTDPLATCATTSAIVTDVCTATRRGAITVRFRLGS